MSQLCITGFGVVSSIGVGKEETLRSLIEERAGLGRVKYLSTTHDEFPVGEVQLSNDEMAASLGIAPEVPMTRTALFGMMALREALHDGGLSSDLISRAAFVSGTTVGGMDKSEQYYLDFLENDSRNAYIATHDVGACSEMIANHFGHFATISSLSTACSSAANAVIYGARLIERGETDVAIVGGSECITKFHLNGFNSLMILDRDLCRPFDSSRGGINLGEGAAYLVLEDADHARRRGAKVYAYLTGYGNTCDAYHQTASSPDGDGAYLAMRKALEMAGLPPAVVSYVNAHGTGTRDNDISESNAMRRLFGDVVPPVSSTKSFTGHTTSASGAIEVAICLLAMHHRFIPANLRWLSGDGCVVPVKRTIHDVELCHVLCNSFGFGGNDTSLLLSANNQNQNQNENPNENNSTTQQLNNQITQQSNNSTSQQLNNSTTQQSVYIYAASQVSVQQPLTAEWMENPISIEEGYNRAIEPDYKKFIQPIEARRMGKLMKRAVAVSCDVLAKCGVEMPDAIISGSGLGCVEYTELFLDPLCREGEGLLKPTYFMQSTHNTVSSSLAIRLKCHGYNTTFSHKNISFDSAFGDAMMQIAAGDVATAMVCGFDEVTPSYYGLLQKIGFLGQPGEPSGECAAALIMGRRGVTEKAAICKVGGHRILYRPTNDQVVSAVDDMIVSSGIKRSDVDAVMLGYNGSSKVDSRYDLLMNGVLRGMVPLHYKHIFGECYSASALGMYAAVCCLQKGIVPSVLRRDGGEAIAVNNLLVVNYDDENNCAITMLVKSEK